MYDYTYNFWSPLLNFKTDESEIFLDKNIKIRKASDFEIDILKDLKKKWTNIIYSDVLLRVRLYKDIPEDEPNQFLPDARKEIEKTITLLRLYKKESIGFNLIVQAYSDEPHYAFSANALFHYMLWTPAKAKALGETYNFNDEDAEKLKNFFLTFNPKLTSKFQLAINFFNKSYIEPYPLRDSLIDLTIALENLFLKKTKMELAYKLSLRMTHLLGKDIDEREKIYRFMKKIYKFRSNVVHGEKTKDLSEKDLLKVREYTRESLKYFLLNPEMWSQEKLDQIIINGSFYPDH
jgi:hypothetical protein